MKKTQSYLGIIDAVVVCVDSYDTTLQGRAYDLFHKGPFRFASFLELLLNMEQLYDQLNFPWPGENERHFIDREVSYMKEEKKKVNLDEQILEEHGDLGTFIVRVQHRQNSSWQGRITWVEQDKTLYFRSVWEMMKLIDEAVSDTEENKTDPSWEER